MSIIFDHFSKESENFSATSLLPSIQKIDPRKGLALSIIITEIARRALIALKEGHLWKFDAPVGDNSCKIRAAKIACIAEGALLDPLFVVEVENLFQAVLAITEKIKFLKEPFSSNTSVSLSAFREQNGLEFYLSSDLIFLIRSHFLFSVKKVWVYEATDSSVLQNIAPVANSVAKNWIHKMKEQLAQSSVEFVQKEAQLIGGNRYAVLKTMVSAPFIKIYESRPVLPNFHCMEILFTRALCQNRFLVLKIAEWVDEGTKKIPENTRSLVLQPDSDKLSFIPTKIDQLDLKQPAIIIEGKRIKKREAMTSFEDIQQSFLKENLFQLLLITASQDPQYLNGEKAEQIPFESYSDDSLIQEEKKWFQTLNQLALEKGVSHLNPSLFLIDHIFCDQIGNHL